jgi:hypothetical protein
MTAPLRGLALAVLLGGLVCACGGGNGGGNTDTPPSTSTDPCANVSVEPDLAVVSEGADESARIAAKRDALDRGSRHRYLDALWLHQQRGALAPQSTAPGRDNADVGDVAVVQDNGDVITPPNTLDLRGAGLRFSRNSSGGYDVRKIDGTFRSTLGRQLTLADDDGAQVNVAFSFNFYSAGQTVAFVNSDGNVTFEEADKSSTERNVSRLLSGPPRVALFLADLDPSTGGKVFANAASDQYTVTWCNVRGFDTSRVVSAQMTLLPDGTIEMKYGNTIGLADAVVGVSPGHTANFQTVNLSDTGPTSGGSAAVGERFAAQSDVDIVALTRKFYQTHADNYDQLVLWSDTSLVTGGTFAYELTVANEVRGIGIDIYDSARDFGSGGRLRSFTFMDFLGKYPDDPTQRVLGENSTLSVLGQECGHRWLAFLEFRDHTGQRSDALLGRDQAHWSFFFDSDASVMEGNDIEDLGGGSFRTTAAVQRYSMLDQYAMGLVTESQVPTFFYVENPTNVVPSSRADSSPRVDVTFNGTRRDVLIQDVIAIHGSRSPSSASSSKVHRQAFIYLVGNGRTADSAQIAKLDRIRREWETFFGDATSGRMRADTRLQ